LGRRIKDDLLQIDQLGKPVDLAFNATDGTKVDLTSEQGRVTAVVFWSAESAPCLVWMKYFAKFADGVPALRVVTVSLDRNREDLDAAMRSLHLAWPTQFDGKGWQNAIARKFGINTVPTLWLLDKQGKLSQLNSRDCYELKVNELLLKK
jgi:cytochrome oxidase Cu insertion factor (SCO1/SenC/PrrC family)